MIRAAIFDWGGTLTPWHDIDPVQQWLAATGDESHAQRLHDVAGQVWARSRDHHRSATLEEVFTLAGIEHTETMVTAFYEWWEPHTYTDPDAVGLFHALRARDIRVGVLSNTIWSREQHQRIFDRDGLSELIDGAVYSSELAWTKPHPEAFRAALAAVGVPTPHEAVFVGDRPFDDIYGASAVGMRTVLVPHSNIPADQVPDHGSGPVVGTPDAVAHRLGEVLEIIDRWTDEPDHALSDEKRA